MGLDILFTEDVRNALLAVDEASFATAVIVAGGDSALLRAYRQGFKAALVAVALVFGVSLTSTELHEIEGP